MRPYHTILTPPSPPRRRKKSIEDVPDELLTEWSYKLFALMNLTWDYVETICNLCIGMRLQPTKPLVREVRALKREYDRFRWRSVDSHMESCETDHALRFEDRFRDDFSRLLNGIDLEVAKLDLTHDHRLLVIAVQQALTLMDAVKIYARWCDREIAGFGVWVCDCCMVQTEFLKLYPLIPQFAGDCYQPGINARKLTASILVNRLKEMPLYELLNEEEYTLEYDESDRRCSDEGVSVLRCRIHN